MHGRCRPVAAQREALRKRWSDAGMATRCAHLPLAGRRARLHDHAYS